MTNPLHAVPPAVNAWNAQYLDEQYRAFKADPAAIPDDLAGFFQGFDLAQARAGAGGPNASAPATGPTPTADAADLIRFALGVASMTRAYRQQGHFAARLDVLGRERTRPASLSLTAHALTDADLTRSVAGIPGLPASAGGGTLAQLREHLESVYCGSIGVQFAHIADPAIREWLRERIEDRVSPVTIQRDDRLAIFDALVRAEGFEQFLQKKYGGEKRFSLEGAECTIAVLEQVLLSASDAGVEEVVVGMPHRGRLNVLNTIMGKTYEQIFTEFEESFEPNFADGGGDVKYHRGYSGERRLRNGRTIHASMASNPSHLESVGPVVAGRVRAKQRLRNDRERRRVLGLLLHGDAAVVGQGVVAELMNMSRLEGYTVGGTVHVVVNNTIGFTTLPEDGRSGPYCTDFALGIDAPIFHVNADDPEAAVAAAHLAVQYRQRFGRDVFIDLYCFRRYGHNEQDNASFTQPVMADLIDRRVKAASTATRYGQRLVADGVIDEARMAEHRAALDQALDQAQQKAKGTPHDPTIDPAGKRWSGMGRAYDHAPVPTAVAPEALAEVCRALGSVPDGFTVNPNLRKLLTERAAIPASGKVNHADGELLAIGTLLLQGTAVRLSGQDCRRGTFSQRHAVIRDFATGQPFTQLNAMRPLAEVPDDAAKTRVGGVATQSRFCVYDSPLSEFAVMGFDYGYSLACPNMLVMWEGQFGDFANGAQTIIDQYLASSEIKWERWSGLTLLLPHGYEGAGPEHSSCRVERFLQLCANDNMQVCAPTTGAQIFHLLRRQVAPGRAFRKPLVVLTPKAWLRPVTSTLAELTAGHFEDVLDDPLFTGQGLGPGGAEVANPADRKAVTRVLLCSGKVYHELAERRELCQRRDTAIVRLEQLYPFNRALFKQVRERYPAKAELIWVQEEPRNAGSYLFVADVLKHDLGIHTLAYIGRPASATPAVGSKTASKREQDRLLTDAIGADPTKKAKPTPVPDAGGASIKSIPASNGSPPAKSAPAARPGPRR